MESIEEIDHFWSLVDPIISKAYENQGVHMAGVALAVGPHDIINSSVPIRGIEDFTGLKIRTGGMTAKVFEKLGVSVVSVPMTETYTAFQLGTIDAGEASGYEGNWNMGFHEVTDYVIEPALTGGVWRGDMLFDLDAWNKLPADLQAIVHSCMEEQKLRSYVDEFVLNREYRLKYIDYGTELIQLPEQDVIDMGKITMANIKEWSTSSPECAEWTQIYHDVLVKFGHDAVASGLE